MSNFQCERTVSRCFCHGYTICVYLQLQLIVKLNKINLFALVVGPILIMKLKLVYLLGSILYPPALPLIGHQGRLFLIRLQSVEIST